MRKNLLPNLTFELPFEWESNLTSATLDAEGLSKKAGQIYTGELVQHSFFQSLFILEACKYGLSKLYK